MEMQPMAADEAWSSFCTHQPVGQDNSILARKKKWGVENKNNLRV